MIGGNHGCRNIPASKIFKSPAQLAEALHRWEQSGDRFPAWASEHVDGPVQTCRIIAGAYGVRLHPGDSWVLCGSLPEAIVELAYKIREAAHA